ncbi:hypothetical protein [Sphingobacterium corticibacter]|uniref:Uncharacterized protein n=1 Tax=Sphingobacterium corticibacter TaxID=2171749 RepID=A0A2T8HFA7_9SPHI|nr:hypothetical protein [Sphingobacterium corticibacter]PVH24094.1 hypothetical protein DC487_15255 [Sphingobacterium corticibacter]
MKLNYFRLVLLFVLSTFFSLAIFSCKKDTTSALPLIEETFKDFTANSGMATHIKVTGTDWMVDYVKLEDQQINLLDSSGQALRLNGQDTAYAANGWLHMAKSTDGTALFLRLKENFEQTPRTVLIGLNSKGQKDEIKIIQHRGSSYRIIDRKFTELEEFRKKYTSDHECTPLQLMNNSSEMKSLPTEDVFKNVKHNSTFESNEYGAFDWLGSEQDSMLFMQELIVDGGSRWSPPVKYQNGTTQTFYLDENQSRTYLDVAPYRKTQLSGKMTYVERVCEYTFTIQNEESGHRFEVSGIWKQTLPLIPNIIIESNTPIVSTNVANNTN